MRPCGRTRWWMHRQVDPPLDGSSGRNDRRMREWTPVWGRLRENPPCHAGTCAAKEREGVPARRHRKGPPHEERGVPMNIAPVGRCHAGLPAGAVERLPVGERRPHPDEDRPAPLWGQAPPVRGGRSRPGPGPLCAPAQTAPEGEDPLRPGAVVDRYRRAGTGVYGANRAREVGAGFARPGRFVPPWPGGWRLRALTSGAWCARSASPRGEPAEPSGVALTRQGGGDDQERRGSLLRTGEGRGRAEGRTRRTSRSSGSRMNNS